MFKLGSLLHGDSSRGVVYKRQNSTKKKNPKENMHKYSSETTCKIAIWAGCQCYWKLTVCD